MLVNLVGNAFDAIAAAKPLDPTVLIETKPANPGGVEFRVTDNGEGIDPERLERVFDAYFSTRAGGMGMGLAISRTIIEAHRGTDHRHVRARSRDDLSIHASGRPWRR